MLDWQVRDDFSRDLVDMLVEDVIACMDWYVHVRSAGAEGLCT